MQIEDVILEENQAYFRVPVELIFTEDRHQTGKHVEGLNDAWEAHHRTFSAASIARLWPHQRLFEYFRTGFQYSQVGYDRWHLENFQLRHLKPPMSDGELLAFRFEQFSRWEETLRTKGASDSVFVLPAKFVAHNRTWMLTDGHHRSAFLRTSGVRWLTLVADRADWQAWINQDAVRVVEEVIASQGRAEYYTPILHPNFQAIRPLRDFAYKSRLDHILEFLGPRVRKGDIVDIGSNAGFFSHHFAREGFNVVGYDPDPNHHDLAVALSALYGSEARFENKRFEQASNNTLFDGALLLTVLYHFLQHGTHTPLLKKLDQIVADFVIWESGSNPESEREEFVKHTKFSSYLHIADTFGTGRARKLGIFCTPEFAERVGEQMPLKQTKAIFDYMATGPWLYEDNQESVSGAGSTLQYTKNFRQQLEKFLRFSGCYSLFDGPCGDFNWMKEVRLPQNMQYFGGDMYAPSTPHRFTISASR